MVTWKQKLLWFPLGAVAAIAGIVLFGVGLFGAAWLLSRISVAETFMLGFLILIVICIFVGLAWDIGSTFAESFYERQRRRSTIR